MKFQSAKRFCKETILTYSPSLSFVRHLYKQKSVKNLNNRNNKELNGDKYFTPFLISIFKTQYYYFLNVYKEENFTVKPKEVLKITNICTYLYVSFYAIIKNFRWIITLSHNSLYIN